MCLYLKFHYKYKHVKEELKILEILKDLWKQQKDIKRDFWVKLKNDINWKMCL